MTDHPVVDLLRAATAAAHQALDGGLDILTRLTGAERVPTLQRYHRLHAACEAAMLPHLSGIPGLDLDRRRRTPLIAADLRCLGAAPPPRTPAAPAIASASAALGMLYVMEGSTLGGRMILRRLQDGGHDTTCLGFLDPYGADTGTMWRDLVAVLEHQLSSEPARTAAIAAATAAFGFAVRCLAPAETDLAVALPFR